MKSDLEPIGGILKETIKRLKIENYLKTGDVFNCWPEIVGKQIADKTQPVSLRAGRLTIKTESATWSQELSFIEEELIDKVNKYAGAGLVKKIIFKTK